MNEIDQGSHSMRNSLHLGFAYYPEHRPLPRPLAASASYFQSYFPPYFLL